MTRHSRAVALAAALLLAGLLVADIVAAESPRSAFRVEEANLDIGTIVAGTVATAIFVFHNDGPEDGHIIRAKPS